MLQITTPSAEPIRLLAPSQFSLFQGTTGPIHMGLVVFCFSLVSGFNPVEANTTASIWWCGAIMAQILIFSPAPRWGGLLIASYFALVVANVLHTSNLSAALLVSFWQTLEPAIGSLIVQKTLHASLSSQGILIVKTTARKIVLGTAASTVWVGLVGALATLSLQSLHALPSAAFFEQWVNVALLGVASYLPLGLGLTFGRQDDALTWSASWAIFIASLVATAALAIVITPSLVVLALVYPITLGISGTRLAAACYVSGLALTATLAWLGWIAPIEPDQAPIFMFVATVCLITGIQFIQRQHAHADLVQSANHDPLTGLLNRRGLARDFNEVKTERPWYFAIADVDHFKTVNDQYGHVQGDRLLQRIAHLLRAMAPPSALCARIGGDEFVITGPVDQIDPPALLNQLSKGFSELGLDSQTVSASFGWSVVPSSQLASEGFKQADQALYSSKVQGRNRITGFSELSSLRSLRMPSSKVMQALENNELFFALQPIVDARTEAVVGHEALIRWRHGEKTLTPIHFIDGFLEISRDPRVQSHIRHLQTQLALSLGPNQGFLSFNLTLDDLLDNLFITDWIKAWAQIAPECPKIVVEVSESAGWVDDMTPAIVAGLQRLKAAGFQIALDDFGKDHSNLNRLVGWPVDRVKLDKSLIDKIGSHTSKACVIISTVKSLCDQMGCPVIAEGVESHDQSTLLLGLGVNVHQGYFWGKPAAV